MMFSRWLPASLSKVRGVRISYDASKSHRTGSRPYRSN